MPKMHPSPPSAAIAFDTGASPEITHVVETKIKKAPKKAKKAPQLIVHDYAGWAAAKAQEFRDDCGKAQAEMMAHGMDAAIRYEDGQKKDHAQAGTLVALKELPDWSFLQTEPGRSLQISWDGLCVNSRLLVSKRRVLSTHRAFGKPLVTPILPTTRAKAIALLALCPPVDGVGNNVKEIEPNKGRRES